MNGLQNSFETLATGTITRSRPTISDTTSAVLMLNILEEDSEERLFSYRYLKKYFVAL